MPQTTLKNQVLIMDPSQMAIDQGWTISGNVATHIGCYPGKLYSKSLSVKPGLTYTAEYKVNEFVSGIVYISLAGIQGTSRNTTGTHIQQFVIPEDATDDKVFFYSDGNLSVEFTAIYPVLEVEDNSVTLGFNVNENKWVNDNYSFAPEMMLRFTNNFYGQQYNSYIDILCNVDYKSNKNWFSLRIDGVGKWYAPQITVPVTNKFPKGMRTRLKKNNFKLINNALWADILKDLNDPKFLSIDDIEERERKAVLGGRDIEGFCLLIRLTCDDITEAKIASLTVYYAENGRNL